MAINSALLWLNKIHNDSRLGKAILKIKSGDFDSYLRIAQNEGFDFTEIELTRAWELSYGNSTISNEEIERILSEDDIEIRTYGTAMGIRG